MNAAGEIAAAAADGDDDTVAISCR